MFEQKADWTTTALDVLRLEAEALHLASNRLDGGFSKAIELLLAHSGKVIVTGVGKSGHVARKIAATLCSTGTPSVYIHPSEAVHGDLGIYQPGDPTILLSKSGSTEELVRLVPLLKQFSSPIIAIVGNIGSTLAYHADAVIDASVMREADPNNLAPTSSTTVAMALGDALALTLMQAKKFSQDDFYKYHPAGQLGRSLSLYVQDVMHKGDNLAFVLPDTPLKHVVIEMTQKSLGAACVVVGENVLVGLITDGDLRRALLKHNDFGLLCASDIMTSNPMTVSPTLRLKDALEVMENRPSQISVLPVVTEDEKRCIGLIRIHDIYRG